MMPNKTHTTAAEAAYEAEQKLRARAKIKHKYEKYFRFWCGTAFEPMAKIVLWHAVSMVRSMKNAMWGEYRYFYMNRDLELIGPFATEEISYATWLLYMEAQDG